MRTIRRKLISLMLGAAMLVSPLLSMSAHTQASPRDIFEEDRFADALMSRENSYASYWEKVRGLPYADDEITAEAAQFSVGGSSAATERLDGKEAALLEGGDIIEAVIHVKSGGLYELFFEYYPLPGSSREIDIAVEIDGELPFDEMAGVKLERIWKDEAEPIIDEDTNNQFPPRQAEAPMWVSRPIKDRDGSYVGPYRLLLTEGEHHIRFTVLHAPVAFAGCAFVPPKEAVTYEEYIKKHGTPLQGAQMLTFEAEKAAFKSDQTLGPSGDRSSPNTTPYHVSKSRVNVIGRNWSAPGQWIEWVIDIPENGYYQLHFRYQQDGIKGMPVNRILTVDGEVPFKEAEAVKFPYTEKWDSVGVKDADGEDAYIYLEAGTRILRLETTTGEMTESLYTLSETVYSLNEMYRKIIMITGVYPDRYNDYNLDTAIPSLMETTARASAALKASYEEVKRQSDGKGNHGELLNRFAYQLDGFLKDSLSIQLRLTEFKDNIGALSAWLMDMKMQPLLIDKIYAASPEQSIPNAKDSFWDIISHEVKAFFSSFFEDFDLFGSKNQGESITLWLNSGRDQAQVIRSMVDEMFTPETGISVRIRLVSASIVQAKLSGNSPDVSIMQGRGQPVNLAARGALLPLNDFEGFDEVMEWFQPTATVPFMLDGLCYALPDSQSFFVTFYRKDVFAELGLEPPKTWDDLRDISDILQRNNMEVGLPYVELTAYDSIDTGMAAGNIFSALLLQNGGRVFNDNLSKTELSSDTALQAFADWTEFYRKNDMPLKYDFYNRFRTGEMPIGIANYTMYNMLSVAAPEIRGLWDIALIPGTESGMEVNISQGSTGSAAMIMKDTKNPQESWEFIKWWTSAEAQTRYINDIEAVMGIAARYPTANLEAFENMGWTRRELSILTQQRDHIIDIPEAVGGYYLVRGLDNAFKEVVLEYRNPREALLVWDRSINAEIERKRREFGYD